MASVKEKIIEAIINTYDLKKQDVDEARLLHESEGISLDKAFIEKGLITESDLLAIFVQELNIPFVNLKKYKIDPALQEIVPERIARQYNVIPLSALENAMTVGVSDPLNVFIIDDLKHVTGREIDVVLCVNSDISKTIDDYYGVPSASSVAEISQDIQVDDFEIVLDQEEQDSGGTDVNEGEKAPVIRIVNLVIKEALRQRSSDIHMEPKNDGMRVRYRIDGVLRDVLTIPREQMNAVIVRIKIMSRLDITISQVPQDGRFKMKLGVKEVDFRVSLLPTTFGQKVVLRVLDRKNLSVGLDGLGATEKNLEMLKEAIRKPFGMVLVTGPTGSGKSTTLYSVLGELNTVDKNVITVEDPVEYLIEGMTQIQAQAEIGLTFAEGLRAILRQSPDIVMVGEIRDGETADIAIKASLTGQLVFSTLHTNDAAGALTRLVDMGVEPFLVASSLVLISAQRLCRKICGNCKEPVEIPKDAFAQLKNVLKSGAMFHRGKGCEQCRGTGYLGRLAVMEVLVVDEDVKNMLLSGKSSDSIKEYARENKGMASLHEDALDKCIQGLTTYEEVLRVTMED